MTTETAPATSEKMLTTRDLRRMYWRSTFLLGSFNFERMQAMGFCYTLMPAIRKVYRGDKAALLQHDDVLHKILNVINLVRRDNDCGAIPHVEIEQSVPERSPHHCIHTQLNLVQKQDWAVARQSEDCIER